MLVLPRKIVNSIKPQIMWLAKRIKVTTSLVIIPRGVAKDYERGREGRVVDYAPRDGLCACVLNIRVTTPPNLPLDVSKCPRGETPPSSLSLDGSFHPKNARRVIRADRPETVITKLKENLSFSLACERWREKTPAGCFLFRA